MRPGPPRDYENIPEIPLFFLENIDRKAGFFFFLSQEMLSVKKGTILTANSPSFLSLEDIQNVNEGIFRPKTTGAVSGFFHPSFAREKRNN
jgi:hypothetical protein